MDAADLDYRARTLTGCIPPDLVSRLVELGLIREVEFQAGRGEWFCAREWARLLAGQDRQAEALEVLAPYVATGWWKAAETMAELLEGWGRTEEAIALARPYAEAGDRLALDFFARLLARHGRGDEAFALLRPHIKDWFLATALVDIAEGAGQDEDAAALLAARIEAGQEHECNAPSCRRRDVEPWDAVDLLAAIRERQGHIDEAITLLHTRDTTSVNGRDQLADLLARHNRIDELRTYAATEYHGHAAQRLAQLLEERGDVEGAIAVYRQPGDSPARQLHGAVQLAQLLVRHGRGDEATEVLRSLADSPGGAEDWIVDELCTHYADQGRAEDGLAYLDALKVRSGGEDWEFFRMRLPLMVACGLREEAIEQARAHPEGGTWYASSSIAELLAAAGRIEEAVAILEQQKRGVSSVLARHLIDLGRVKAAIALLQQHEPRPAKQLWTGEPADVPPF
ncbi:tetratricopeptide repeat protein [Micromonospora sp. NPDC003197]